MKFLRTYLTSPFNIKLYGWKEAGGMRSSIFHETLELVIEIKRLKSTRMKKWNEDSHLLPALSVQTWLEVDICQKHIHIAWHMYMLHYGDILTAGTVARHVWGWKVALQALKEVIYYSISVPLKRSESCKTHIKVLEGWL